MIIQTAEQMEKFGQQLGARLRGGEIIELIGDIGAGKTTLTYLIQLRRRHLPLAVIMLGETI